MKFSRVFIAALLLSIPAALSSLHAQATEVVSPERMAARAWYQNAKFGMFIHWGVYSQLGQGEWVMQVRGIPVDSYEWLASAFNPIKFNAHDWVATAKAAGMQYITITSRHHDGFSMFKSNVTPYNIVDFTPFKRDLLKGARRRMPEAGPQAVLLLPHSSTGIIPTSSLRGGTGLASGRPESGDWNKYLDFMDAQLTELLTNYGPIGGIWFDGMWDKPTADWRLQRTYDLIHRLQPSALIVPNHHKAPLPGEDVQTFEQDLPEQTRRGSTRRKSASCRSRRR